MGSLFSNSNLDSGGTVENSYCGCPPFISSVSFNRGIEGAIFPRCVFFVHNFQFFVLSSSIKF